MQRTWTILVSLMLACGGTQHEVVSVSEVELPEPVNDESSIQRGALEALSSVRQGSPELAAWRPTSVVRLDDTIAVLDRSHAFIWEEDAWRHVELPGPAPFGVGSMGRPEETVKGDGHRAVFAGPSAPGAQTIGLFQLTREGVETLGVLPDWVAACRSFVASGTHLYAVVSDEPREREIILHAEQGATAADWQPLDFEFPSDEPDQHMLMTPEGAILDRHDRACELLRLPAEGPSYEPTLLFTVASSRSCNVHSSQGLTPSRLVVTGSSITIIENGEQEQVEWPADGVPFERPDEYDDYDELTESEQRARENDSMARRMSPGLVAFRPLLFERLHPTGEMREEGGGFMLPLSSSFHREEDGQWVALPEEEGEAFGLVAAMNYAALTRPGWTTPVNWGPFRIAVAQGRWASESPMPTLSVWRDDSPELVTSAFPSLSRR